MRATGSMLGSTGGSAALLVASLALVSVVAAVGGVAASRSVGDWYEGLDRAPFGRVRTEPMFSSPVRPATFPRSAGPIAKPDGAR